MQGVESVEELFLSPLLLGKELDVVHQQHVHVAELVAEAGHLVIAERVNHLIGELLAGDIADSRLGQSPLDFVSDGLHQVSFAHTDATIEEKRVIGFGRTLRHRLASRMRELISAANDERVKGVTRVQLRRPIPIEARLRYMRGSCRVSRQATIVPHRSGCGIVLGGDKLHFLKFHAEVVDCFLDQVSVFITYVAEFCRGHTHEKNPTAGVAVASRF